MLPAALEQVRDRGLAQVEGPRGVHRDHGVEALDALVGAVRRAADARDVAQHVEATERVDHIGDERLACAGVGDVDLAGLRRTAVINDVLGRVGRTLAVDVGTPDRGAFGREAQRGGAPDAAGGAGHERDLVPVAVGQVGVGERVGRRRHGGLLG